MLRGVSGNFCVLSGAEIRPHSQWYLGDFFPNFEKKSQSSKFGIFIQQTHKVHVVTFFNLMAIVCVIAYLFFY